MLKHSTQSGAHPHTDRGHDLYETPAVAVEALLRVESLPHLVWEPAAGNGAIVRVLRDAGHAVIASDLVRRDFPLHFDGDFMAQMQAPVGCDCILTNPPFKIIDPFIAHALDLCPRVIVLARLALLESIRRTDIIENRGLARVHVFKDRLPMMHRDGWAGRKASSAIAYAWFCWDREHHGPFITDRISHSPKAGNRRAGSKPSLKESTMSKPTLKAVGNGPIEPQTAASTPADAEDFASLWLDPGLGDGITDTNYHDIPAGKPKDFFRTVPDPAYRRRTEIYVHKSEGMIDEQTYIIAPAMRGRIDEATPCTLVTVVYRDGSPRIWPVKLPKDGARDNEAWKSARSAAKAGIDRWVKLVWQGRAYRTREAQPGYAPDPDFTKLPPFNELIKIAFGDNGVIRDTNHPIYRELFGIVPLKPGDDDADL